MRRRHVIKSAGGIAFGSSLLSIGNTVSAKNNGLKGYERYCQELVKKHGDVKDQRVAINNNGKSQTVGDVSRSMAASVQSSSKKALEVKEEHVYEDGTIIEESVTSEDGSIIRIEINNRQFKFRRAEAEKKLEERTANAKKELGLSSPENKRTRDRGQHNQVESTTDASRTDVTVSSQSQTHSGFSNGDRRGLSTPASGGTYNRHGWDYANTAADAAVAGAASGYAESWNNHDWSNGSLLINFKGDYNAAAWNVLASSELRLFFYVESGGERISETNALYKGSFLADYWHDESEYETAIYMSDPPSSFRVTMRGYSVAAAIGSSTTAVSAADPAGGNHDGHFEIDNYEFINQ